MTENEGSKGEGSAKDSEEVLGENGIKALASEREARKSAEKEIRELRKSLADKDSQFEQTLAEAVTAAKREVATTFGSRLATAEFAKLASKRNNTFDVDPVLKLLPMSDYMDEAGELVQDRLIEAVNTLVPEAKSDQQQGIDLDMGFKNNGTNGKRSNAEVFAKFAEERLNRG
jgi:hypothetical protein